MNISPPGGLPCHPRELGNDLDYGSDIIIKTGLLGIIVLFSCVFLSILILVISSPLMLLGVVEVVAARPNHYRVRWIRRDLL